MYQREQERDFAHFQEHSFPQQKRQFADTSVGTIPTFDGDWLYLSDFMDRFNVVSAAFNWTEEEKCRRFPLYLRGYASDVYHDLSAPVRNNFNSMKQLFCQGISIPGASYLFSVQLRQRQQHAGEPVRSFASDLCKLFNKAYPDMDMQARNILLRDYFLIGVREDIRHKLLEKDLSTFEEAVQTAISWEMLFQYLMPKKDTVDVPRTTITQLTELVHKIKSSTIQKGQADQRQADIDEPTHAVHDIQNLSCHHVAQPPEQEKYERARANASDGD
jgi:hypothetical protein